MSDSNLLLGLLALQHGFVTRDQLNSAVTTWVKDKSQSIGTILESDGALAADAGGLLVHLTEAHLANHDHDVQKSMQALSLQDSVEEDLRAHEDSDIEATLGGNSTMRKSVDPSATLAFTPEMTTNSGRFELLRPHAEGGIGEVWVAKDRALNREVALKKIKRAYSDNDDSRARFVAEAEITGGLEHPGIVPVYALDDDAEGQPSYAMRFIRGTSLKEAADEFHDNEWSSDVQRGMEIRKLLRRMVDVCNTMQYAHSRGVLHRDLKPANVMLGKYGETLIVDWGLAKSTGRSDDSKVDGEATLQPTSGSSSTPTMFGKAIGTPAYMPPEQAAGRLSELAPVSDVYSLGATLYYVLTGQPPYTETELSAILRAVQDGRLVAPRKLNHRVPKPLEAICLKAMAVEKHKRYQSATDLADDIERFLADEPVQAHSDSLAVRSRRWMRRHPKLVTGVAATLLVGLVSVVATAIVVSNINAELSSANGKLSAALELRDLAKTEAKKAKKLATEKTAEAAEAKREVAAIYDYLKSLTNSNALPAETMRMRQQLLGERWAAVELLWSLSQSKAGKQQIGDLKELLNRVAGAGQGKPQAGSKSTSTKSQSAKTPSTRSPGVKPPAGLKSLLEAFGKLGGAQAKKKAKKGG